MKQKISKNIRWSRFLFAIAGLVLIYQITVSVTQDKMDKEFTAILVLSLILCFVVFFLLSRAKTIEYDAEFLHITSKNEEEKIPLKDINKVIMTMFSLNNQSIWKIGYIDKDGIRKIVRMLPSWTSEIFEEFKNSVKKANSDAQIQDKSVSFDNDFDDDFDD
jgi:hypothetical protein